MNDQPIPPAANKVRLGMTVSLDGFVTDRHGDLNPLYPDLEALRKTKSLQEAIRNTGAVVMGRHAYDLAQGDLTNYEFQTPIFVVTHHIPDRMPRGQNEHLKVYFVPEGIAAAIEHAKQAAGGKEVLIIGGADVAQQCIVQRLVDEIEVNIMPLLLGGGLRMFDNLGPESVALERIQVYTEGEITYMRFRFAK